MPTMTSFHGLIPAMAVPFRADFSIDEQELTSFARWLAAQPGVVGMMTNGHTGEVFSLTPRERAEVTRIGKVKVPLLILHGAFDRVVPMALGERLLALANEPKRLARFPRGGHNDLDSQGAQAVVREFLNE